ncbi:GNAT family N-acetyltransferase [Haloarcula sp. S1CR25-12]|uniref:GNAT family N-acetyltransferase n=1 Tax=Haloarcula saliterrae TaxID=2950534 RepID=A0ABU2FJG3_9EURY|nr:GNAT family protein [Haloarcula sp. S1CR25-12]MDS0261891.1 GNAT family N-acetyltransferase [Haloarcula sp. S1CR25-12]
MVQLQSNRVMHDGVEIGQFVFEDNHIEKLDIKHEYQNKGYGTEALRLYLKNMVSQNYDVVTTTPVTSSAMAHILEKLGFQRISNPAQYDFLDGNIEERYLSCYIHHRGTADGEE